MTGFFRRKKMKEKRGEKISATILLISGNLFFFKQDNKSTFQFQYQNPGLKKKTSDCD